MKGRFWINNQILQHLIKPEEWNNYCSNGYTKGRLFGVPLKGCKGRPCSDLSKQKISLANSNPSDIKRLKISNARKNKIWIKNEHLRINKLIRKDQVDFYFNLGYTFGQLRFS